MSEEKEQKMETMGRGKDDVALDMMKFIATTTGYGKGATAAGFSAKSATRTPEEHAAALIELFLKCRDAVKS
jgi:hypothetical protein